MDIRGGGGELKELHVSFPFDIKLDPLWFCFLRSSVCSHPSIYRLTCSWQRKTVSLGVPRTTE